MVKNLNIKVYNIISKNLNTTFPLQVNLNRKNNIKVCNEFFSLFVNSNFNSYYFYLFIQESKSDKKIIERFCFIKIFFGINFLI